MFYRDQYLLDQMRASDLRAAAAAVNRQGWTRAVRERNAQGLLGWTEYNAKKGARK